MTAESGFAPSGSGIIKKGTWSGMTTWRPTAQPCRARSPFHSANKISCIAPFANTGLRAATQVVIKSTGCFSHTTARRCKWRASDMKIVLKQTAPVRNAA